MKLSSYTMCSRIGRLVGDTKRRLLARPSVDERHVGWARGHVSFTPIGLFGNDPIRMRSLFDLAEVVAEAAAATLVDAGGRLLTTMSFATSIAPVTAAGDVVGECRVDKMSEWTLRGSVRLLDERGRELATASCEWRTSHTEHSDAWWATWFER